MIGEAHPTVTIVTGYDARSCFPHVQMVLLYETQSVVCGEAQDRALYNGAWYGLESGRYAMAEKITRSCLRSREIARISYDSVGITVHTKRLTAIGLWTPKGYTSSCT